jgi:hypothetical protein
MILYILATTQVVSAALVVEREEPGRSQKVQRSVYFISEVLSDSKTRYSQMQKLVYTILMTKRKLRHYFDAHPITVVSEAVRVSARGSHPEPRGRREDRQVGARADGTEHHVRTVQRHQVTSTRGLRGRLDRDSNSPSVDQHETWTMYFDGSVMKEGAGVGLVFISPLGVRMEYMVRLHFPA